MKKPHLKILSIAALLVAFISCDDNGIDYPYKQEIRVTNHSDMGVDSLIIRDYNSLYSGIPLVFTHIGPGSQTIPIESEDLLEYLHFYAYINGDTLTDSWQYPNYTPDPAGSVNLPSGFYDFAIIECDTLTNKLLIGLSAFNYW